MSNSGEKKLPFNRKKPQAEPDSEVGRHLPQPGGVERRERKDRGEKHNENQQWSQMVRDWNPSSGRLQAQITCKTRKQSQKPETRKTTPGKKFRLLNALIEHKC